MNGLFTTLLGVALKHHGDIDDDDGGDPHGGDEPWIRENGQIMRTQQTVRQGPPTQGQAAPPKRMTLNAITKGAQRAPWRILIYGVGGVGKSTFMSEAPAPVFLDTQYGTDELNTNRFPKPQTFDDVRAAFATLINEEHAFKTLVIDLVDDVERLIWDHVCKKANAPSITSGELGYNKGYEEAAVQMRLALRDLETLRRKGMNIGFVGHSAITKFVNPEGADYERYSLALQKSTQGLIYGWCDAILFAREETAVQTKGKKTRGISTGHRVVHTVENAAYYAKNRYNLPNTLPLDWHDFAEAMALGQPANAQAVVEEIEGLLARANDNELSTKVRTAIAAAGDDASRLVRYLNTLRERVDGAEQADQQEGEQS